jgi:hypothetical protein
MRLATEQEVSPLSMDAAYDPDPALDLGPRPIGGEGPVTTYATVLLRAMCASEEPSLTPRESVQWAAYTAVKLLAPLVIAHPDPATFDTLVRGMCDVRTRPPDPELPWFPMRCAIGWLLLAELRKDPPAARDAAADAAAEWAGDLARRIAEEHGDEAAAPTDAYALTLFGDVRATLEGSGRGVGERELHFFFPRGGDA